MSNIVPALWKEFVLVNCSIVIQGKFILFSPISQLVIDQWSIVIKGKFSLTSPSRQLKCINLLVLICLLVDCFVWFKLPFATKPHSTFFTPLYFVYLCVPFQCFPWIECLLTYHTYQFYVFLHVFSSKTFFFSLSILGCSTCLSTCLSTSLAILMTLILFLRAILLTDCFDAIASNVGIKLRYI